jgi:hypothetical protein
MKTSLNIEDSLYHLAKKEAASRGKTISEVISSWARIGMEYLSKKGKEKRPALKTVNLGSTSQIDLNSRRDWMDLL